MSITHRAAHYIELVHTRSQLELCHFKLSLSTLPKLSYPVYMVSSEIIGNIEGAGLALFLVYNFSL